MPLVPVLQPAPDLTLRDATGPVRLSEQWQRGPVVLVFLRHFG